MPLLLLVLLATVQFAVAEHAQHLAQAVADRALAVARAQDATASDGQAEAEAQLVALAGPSLQHPVIHVTRDATRAQVEISGEAAAVIPGLHLHVSAQTTGDVEAFTTPDATGR
jgi:Flp pilus assembly protein TadG